VLGKMNSIKVIKAIPVMALLLFSGVYSQKDIYESDKFEDLSSDHTTLAILPFFTYLDLDDNVSRAELSKLEEKEG
jgi:hypothetical protein